MTELNPDHHFFSIHPSYGAAYRLQGALWIPSELFCTAQNTETIQAGTIVLGSLGRWLLPSSFSHSFWLSQHWGSWYCVCAWCRNKDMGTFTSGTGLRKGSGFSFYPRQWEHIKYTVPINSDTWISLVVQAHASVLSPCYHFVCRSLEESLFLNSSVGCAYPCRTCWCYTAVTTNAPRRSAFCEKELQRMGSG